MKNHDGVSSPCHLLNQAHINGKTVKDNEQISRRWDLKFNPGGRVSHSFFEEISRPRTDKIMDLSHYVEGPPPMQDSNTRKMPLRLTISPVGRSLTRQEHHQMQKLVQQYYKAAEEQREPKRARQFKKIASCAKPLKVAIPIKQDLDEYWGRLERNERESEQWKIMRMS